MRRENLLRDVARGCRLRLGLHDERRRNEIAAEDDAQLRRLQLAQHVGHAPARVGASLLTVSRYRGEHDDSGDSKNPGGRPHAV